MIKKSHPDPILIFFEEKSLKYNPIPLHSVFLPIIEPIAMPYNNGATMNMGPVDRATPQNEASSMAAPFLVSRCFFKSMILQFIFLKGH